MNDSLKKRLIDIRELSAYLGFSKHTIYGWISEKRMPFPYFKLKKQVRFDLKDVDKWLQSRKIQGRPGLV